MNILAIENLVKRFGSLTAVDGITFGVPEGCCFGLLGPNGAGKTTTVEIMENITMPTSGQVLFHGEPLQERFREQAGIQFQHTALQEFLSVKETLRLFSRLYRRSVDLDKLIEQCSLQSFLHQETHKISGGQKQRLLLAIALVNDPQVLFLDEPTTGLDPQSRHHFWQLIESIKARQKTIILTTHYMEEAAGLCDELVIMDRGKIIAAGSPDHLLKTHFDESIVSLPIQAAVRWDDELLERLNGIKQGNLVYFYSRDIPSTIAALNQQGVELKQLQVRARTLEDLFLQLTGKGLRH